MKLIRFGAVGDEKLGVELNDGKRIDVSGFGQDFDQNFLEKRALVNLKKWLQTHAKDCPVVADSVRLGPPLQRPSKIVCVGLNYAKHAAESGMAIPEEPVLFFKASSAICGPFDEVIIPKGGDKTDWEVELAVVIGKEASYVNESDAMKHVAGYVLHNDISERGFQLERSGQWVKGKSCDTFAPLGPFIATADEIANPNNLELWLELNGKRVQHSSTSDFIFNIAEVISYISQFMTLLPGDIISTGTPSGVGLGFDPPVYLKPGDHMRLGIEGLGESEQVCKAHSGS